MNPFMQTVIVSLITGGGVAAFLTFLQFMIKRHDDNEDKSSGEKAELERHGKQLETIKKMIDDGNKEQKQTHDQLAVQGTAIAGLEHDRIIHVGKGYLQKGRISVEEYEDLRKYLYEPYKALGGNGTAENIMNLLTALVEKGESDE